MHIDRRTSFKWLVAAGMATQLPEFSNAAAPGPGNGPATGYGKDPDVMRAYAAGDLWPLTLNEAQLRTTTALCDIIIPADEHSPAASALGVPAFVNEWISAPYPRCVSDRDVVLPGLAWLDAEARRRHSSTFDALSPERATALCDELAAPTQPATPAAPPAKFFERFRELAAIGYYTTPVGRKDLGYVGNEPLPAFNGPPLEVLKRVGLA